MRWRGMIGCALAAGMMLAGHLPMAGGQEGLPRPPLRPVPAEEVRDAETGSPVPSDTEAPLVKPLVQTPDPDPAAPGAEQVTEAAPNSLRSISLGKVFTPVPVSSQAKEQVMPPPAVVETISPRDPYLGATELKSAHWVAPELRHRTLYFEDVALERFGVSWGPCLQPIVSGWRFVADIYRAPTLQYYQPPCAVQYTLGYPRPGSPPEAVYEESR
jgi:hypothetical protein